MYTYMYMCVYIYIYILLVILIPEFLPKFFPLGVVVRFRSVFAEHIILRPNGQQLLKLFCSWDRKSLEHTLSSHFG